ncbi:MAG TPA: tetratricopeptide repeat protein, partial [Candidatus Polarisedimenticolia bacterium]|nr:tetratricopeptide repeat protein [Candidatus Polarisedimenticolia bacterium]
NTLGNGLVVDDLRQIRNNPLIRDVRHIPQILTTGVWEFEGRQSSYYRPLIHVFYLAVYLLLGPDPWGFHLLNVLFHAGVSVLVYLLLRRLLPDGDPPGAPRLQRSAPLLGALLFAAHPVHTEAVAWAAGIVDVTFTFFCLLSLYFYLARRDYAPGAGVGVSLVAFFLATLCKEPALTLPAIIVACDLLLGGKDGRGRAAASRWLLYLLVAGFYLALRMNALHGLAPVREEIGLGRARSLLTILQLFALDLEKLVLPIHLNFFHHFRPPPTMLSGNGVVVLASFAAFAGASLVAWRRCRPALFGLLLIALPLLPTFYLPALNQGLQNAFAERYLYLPSFGFVFLLAAGLHHGWRIRAGWAPGLGLALLALVILYSAGTARRNLVWRSASTLWADTVRKSPDSAIAHQGYGLALLREGRRPEGEKELRTAVGLDPDLPDASLRKGLAYGRQGMLNDAIISFHTALALDPDSAEAHYALAVAYDDKGWIEQAIVHYEKTLALQPGMAQAHNNLGVLQAKGGRLEEARRHFEAAVRLRPDDSSYRANLERARKEIGQAGMVPADR